MSSSVTQEPRATADGGRHGGPDQAARRGAPAGLGLGLVRDADPRRAQATEELLGALAASLGLRIDAIRVYTDAEAATRTRVRGARGLMADGAIWLDPERYDPTRADGRALLAHEAAHAAQRAEVRLRPDRRAPSLAEAEAEAAAVAAAVFAGRAPGAPQATLPPGEQAADTGATATEVAPSTAPARDAPPAPEDPLVAYRAWRSELAALVPVVREAYPRQLHEMRDHLDGLVVSDGDIDEVMSLVEPLPAEDAAALVRALGADLRVRLVDRVSSSQMRNFRLGVLASYAGLTAAEVRRFDEHLFVAMPLTGMSVQERFLAVMTLLELPVVALRTLKQHETQGRAVDALMTGAAPSPGEQLDALRARPAALAGRRQAQEALAEEPATRRLLARLRALLRDPSDADARAAIDLLAGILPAATPATPEPAAGGGGSTGATPAARSEATEPAPEPSEPAIFAVVVDRLEEGGENDRLVRRLPASDRGRPGERRDAFLAVLRHRPPDANVRYAISLLSYGFFDWAITDGDARLAYDLIRALPLDARDRFLRRDDGQWLQRLEENLPADVLERDDFAGLSVGRGRLVDAGALHAQALRNGGGQVLARILDMWRDSDNAETATRILDEVVAITDALVRAAVAERLDLLGKLPEILERLPGSVLYSEGRRLDLMTVMAARDPRHLERHIRRLISTSFFDWAVTSHEAFLAFQMLRALPETDRERFGQLDFIVGEMSADMRASAGMHMLDASSAVRQRDAVRARLVDERMWMAEHAAALRGLVQIAVALGDRRWVFEQSELRRAWEIPELHPMVARFELYDEAAGRTRYVPDEVQEAGFWEDFGFFSVMRLIGTALWIVVRDGFRGRVYVNPSTERLGHTGADLYEAQEMLGNDLGGARLRDPQAPADDNERAGAATRRGASTQTIRSNEVSIELDRRARTLRLELPALELDSIGRVGTGFSAHTGRVSARGIRVGVEFHTPELSVVRSGDLIVDDLEMDDIVLGGTTSLSGAARLHVSPLRISGDMGTEPSRPPQTTMLPIPIFGPIIEAISMLIDAAGVSSQVQSGARALRGMQVEVGTFEVEGVSIGADRQIASLSIAGLRLAWGGTRTQYLRALVAALDRRIETATAAAERTRLTAQRGEAQAELSALEPGEARMIALYRREQADPGSLTADEHAELLRLQQTGRGGVVVDAGTIAIRGVTGDISVSEVTIERLRGQGTSEALTTGILTDEAFLRRFVEHGPPQAVPDLRDAPGDIQLEAGTVTAVDIAREAQIPPTADLEAERERLVAERDRVLAAPPGPAVAGVTGAAHEEHLRWMAARRTQLDGLIAQRRALDALEELGTGATPEQARRRRDLHSELARHFGTTVERVVLGGASIGAGLPLGGVSFGAQSYEVTGVRSDAYSVERIGGTGAHITAEPVPGGWRISDLRLATLALNGIDYGTATRRVRSSRPLTLNGISASLTYTTEGEGDAQVTVYAIDRVDIESITVAAPPSASAPEPGLEYDDFAMGLRVALFGGSLHGVWATGVTLRMTKQATEVEREAAGVRRFDALQFAAAYGDSFSLAGGTLSSPTGAEEDAFGVEWAQDGETSETRIRLRGLTLADARLRTASGSVRIESLPMSGQVSIRSHGDTTEIGLEQFSIPQLVLGAIDWRTSAGAQITARGTTELRGIVATAGIQLDAAGVASATVTGLHIDAITGEDIRYRDPPLDIHVDRASSAGRPPLDIVDVDVQGLHWDRRLGLTSGTVDVASAAVGLDARLTADLRAEGTLRAERIFVRFLPGDRIEARARDVDVDAAVTLGTTTAALAISDLDTGEIRVSPGQVRIGGGAALDRLRIGRIHISSLHFDDGSTSIDVAGGGRGIVLNELSAALTIDLNPAGTTPRIRRITIEELDLADLLAERLTIADAGTAGIAFTAPFSQAFLRGIRVRGLAVEPTATGWGMTGFEELHLDELRLSEVDVDVSIGDIMRRRAAAAEAAAAAAGTPASAGGFDPASLLPFQDVINHLDGHVNLDLVLPIYVTVDGTRYRIDNLTQDAFWLRLEIDHGQVDVAEIENTTFESEFDSAVDFEIVNGQLALEIDPSSLLAGIGAVGGAAIGSRGGVAGAVLGGAIGGGAGLIGGQYLKTEILYWNITAGELVDLQPLLDYDIVHAGPRLLSLFSLTQYSFPPSGGSSRVFVDSANVELNDIDAWLALVNEAPLLVTLPGGAGSFTLSPQALTGLTVRGSLPGAAPLRLGLRELAVASMELNIAGVGQLTSDELRMSGLGSGQLTMAGFSPERFTGRVQRLSWSNVTLRPPAATPPSAPAPAPAPPVPAPAPAAPVPVPSASRSAPPMPLPSASRSAVPPPPTAPSEGTP